MLENDPTQPMGPAVGTAAPAKRRSLKWLWITLGVVAGLLVVGGGAGAYALVQYTAPGAAASQFCADLKAQTYDTAYGMLSAKLQATYTNEQFRLATTTLDAAEGKVTACTLASGSGAYSYRLGSRTATVVAVITRDKQGKLQGGVHLVNETGAWKIDRMETSLLGIHLGALQALGGFCAALQAQNYAAAFGFLSSSFTPSSFRSLPTVITGLLTPLTQDTFVQGAQAQDQLDGTVRACALSAIASGNTDTATTVTATITRTKLGAKSGTIVLDGTGSTWKITQIDAAIQGTDEGPLVVGGVYCLALQAGNYQVAYSLLSRATQAAQTEAQYAMAIANALTAVGPGAKLGACKVDLSTYQVSGSTAQYSGTLDVVVGTTTIPAPITLKFVLEGGVWKITLVG